MAKPNINDVDYLNKVCRYCSEHAAFKVNFKDGTSILACPTHTRDFAPTVDRPPWYGNFQPPATHEAVENIEMWPPEQGPRD